MSHYKGVEMNQYVFSNLIGFKTYWKSSGTDCPDFFIVLKLIFDSSKLELFIQSYWPTKLEHLGLVELGILIFLLLKQSS